MRMTFLGHAGWFAETRHGSVLCDPSFTPAYFGSWFPFPRNDGLDPAVLGEVDYLYVSHLHRDHFDPAWLARNVNKEARVLLPEFGIDLLARELESLGFRNLVRTTNGERLDLDGLGVTVFAMTSPAATVRSGTPTRPRYASRSPASAPTWRSTNATGRAGFRASARAGRVPATTW